MNENKFEINNENKIEINNENKFWRCLCIFCEIISYYDDEKCATTEKCAEILLCMRLKFYSAFDWNFTLYLTEIN